MRIVLVLVLALTSGCDVLFGLQKVGGDGACVGRNGASSAGVFGACLDAVGEYQPRASISTGVGADHGNCTSIEVQTDAKATEVCVIAATDIVLASPVEITGSRPLVLVATGDIHVGVDLDLSSQGSVRGPGAGYVGCAATPGMNSNTSMTSSGGGAGGSFGSRGGNGGRGNVMGGVAAQAAEPAVVRGGCDGGVGGAGAGTGSPGTSGASGGALYLVAGGTITIASTINVSGAGGGGGGRASPNSYTAGGGGGGGSGGMLALDAPSVLLEATAVLVANGGGGGGGGGGYTTSGETTTVGGTGEYPDLTMGPPFGTDGGVGGSPGGGAGGAGSTPDGMAIDGDGQTLTGGGGGGGGGAGVIVIYSDNVDSDNVDDRGAVASPAIVIH